MNLYDSQDILVQHIDNTLVVKAPFGSMEYDLGSGLSAFFRCGETKPVLQGLYAQVLVHGQAKKSNELCRDKDSVAVTAHADSFGTGVKLSVLNRGTDLCLVQNYYLYPGRTYFLCDTVLETPGASTNYIAPLAADSFTIPGSDADPRFLFVPFDNDEFVRYASHPLDGKADWESYEVTAIFDNTSRRGFVTGSVTHDTWKTGIRIERNGRFTVFGGITSYETRDTEDSETNKEVQPHGMVSGAVIPSPLMFLGFFDDWRDGMEAYGRANGITAPPLSWKHGPPFGWNSWSAVAKKLDYDIFTGAADFLKHTLPHFTNGKNPVYINFDAAGMDNKDRVRAAQHVYDNDQIPGMYHTPFTCWHDSIEKTMTSGPEGAGEYAWYDLILKDAQGKPLQYMHGKRWPLDPTHPGTVKHNDFIMKRLKEWGFRYCKLDFLSHGAMEGCHYDPAITTGIQAYNYGLNKLLEALGDAISNEEFFLSFSIAPVFPCHQAHGRRISCDVFGEISWAEYQLNSLNYGWWLHGTVLPYNDPDHIVLYTSFNRPAEKGPILETEGLSRYVAAAITGGIMIHSDDIRSSGAGDRAQKILNNTAINALVSSGRTFRPVEGNTGNEAGCLYVRDDRVIDGSFYLAVFNFSDTQAQTMTIDLERIGLDAGAAYSVREMVSGQGRGEARRTLPVSLDIAQPQLYRFIKN